MIRLGQGWNNKEKRSCLWQKQQWEKFPSKYCRDWESSVVAFFSPTLSFFTLVYREMRKNFEEETP